MAGERSSRSSKRTLADRINALAESGAYTDEAIVVGIRDAGGPQMSVAYLNHLRRGRRTNPTMATLEGLARFFCVPIGSLFDDEYGDAELSDEDRRLLSVIHSAGLGGLVEQLGGLPEETRESVERIVNDLHRLHGANRRRPRG